jgi:hypothetical protein
MHLSTPFSAQCTLTAALHICVTQVADRLSATLIHAHMTPDPPGWMGGAGGNMPVCSHSLKHMTHHTT